MADCRALQRRSNHDTSFLTPAVTALAALPPPPFLHPVPASAAALTQDQLTWCPGQVAKRTLIVIIFRDEWTQSMVLLR